MVEKGKSVCVLPNNGGGHGALGNLTELTDHFPLSAFYPVFLAG